MNRRDTSGMLFLDEPVPFRAHGRDCYGFVTDGRMVFARWFADGKTHLQWLEKPSVGRRLGVL